MWYYVSVPHPISGRPGDGLKGRAGCRWTGLEASLRLFRFEDDLCLRPSRRVSLIMMRDAHNSSRERLRPWFICSCGEAAESTRTAS